MITGNLYNGKEKIPFEIPEGYNELSVSQLSKISELEDDLEIFSALTDIPLDTVKKCRKEEVFYIVDQLNGLYDPSKLEESQEYLESFELEGTRYYVDKDIISIPAGQWWDMKKYEADLRDKPLEFIPRMLSILCRPKGEEYSHSKSSERLELFGKLDVETAFRIRGFFLHNLLKYLKDLNLYSKKTTRLRRLLQGIRSWLISSARFLLFTPLQRIRKFYLRCLGKGKR